MINFLNVKITHALNFLLQIHMMSLISKPGCFHYFSTQRSRVVCGMLRPCGILNIILTLILPFKQIHAFIAYVSHFLSLETFVLYVLFIALSILLRFTASKYPFGIFKFSDTLLIFYLVLSPSVGL